MAREQARPRGRQPELAALRTALGSDTGRVVVLRGPAGIGRTTVLTAMAGRLAADGLRVLSVPFSTAADDSRPDAYGIGPLLRAVRAQYEQVGDLRLADSLSAVSRMLELLGRDPDWWVPRMAAELATMFERFAGTGRIAIIADDVHLADEPALLLACARRLGCLVLAGCRDDVEHTLAMDELLITADEVITLGPLADEDVRVLSDRAAGAPLDDSVPGALRAALGPLYGNPGTTLGAVAELRTSGRLVLVRDRLCLRVPEEPVALPTDHDLVWRAAQCGPFGLRLLGAVAAWDGFGVDDLPSVAEALGVELAECGRVLDQLIAGGVLVADAAGRVECRCLALAAFALGHLGVPGRHRLHADIAANLLANRRAGRPVESTALADHIADAGTCLAVNDEIAAWLLEMVAVVRAHQPERAARWYAAVLAADSGRFPGTRRAAHRADPHGPHDRAVRAAWRGARTAGHPAVRTGIDVRPEGGRRAGHHAHLGLAGRADRAAAAGPARGRR